MPTIPKDCEELSKRIETILWLSNQLSILGRSKPSKMVESLKSELIARLEDPNASSYTDLSDAAVKASQMLTEKDQTIGRLKSELENRPFRETVRYEPDPDRESTADRVIPEPGVFNSKLLWMVVGIIGTLIFQYMNHFHS